MALFDRILSRFEEIGATILITVAVLVTFAEVIRRYVFGGSLGFANEVTIVSVIWATMFGASLGVREGIHIGVDVVVEHFPPRIARLVNTFSLLASALWIFMVGVWGVDFVTFLMRTNRLTSEMEIPAWTVNFVVPLAAFMMAFRFVQAAVRYWQTPLSIAGTHNPATAQSADEVAV